LQSLKAARATDHYWAGCEAGVARARYALSQGSGNCFCQRPLPLNAKASVFMIDLRFKHSGLLIQISGL